MIDQFGRNIHKLRIQLLDACQMRCIYCMPKERKFSSPNTWMSPVEIFEVSNQLNKVGIDEIRLTGGEPLLRKDFIHIVDKISQIPLKKIGVTTNGLLLNNLLAELAKTNLKHINISLDTLNPLKFGYITGVQNFKDVYRSIMEAVEFGFEVKINMVVLRGINDDEILDFVEFAENNNVCVRFLELMNVGVARKLHGTSFMSCEEVEAIIRKRTVLKKMNVPLDNTSFDFSTEEGGKIGFIASETKSFCNTCSRLRVSAQGILRPCLFKNEGELVRNKNQDEFVKIVERVISQKPIKRIEEIVQPMYAIGG